MLDNDMQACYHAIELEKEPRTKTKRTNRKEKNMKDMKNLIARMNAAMDRIGGPLAVLGLPDEVKEIVINCNDYETRVKMLELVAEQIDGRHLI